MDFLSQKGKNFSPRFDEGKAIERIRFTEGWDHRGVFDGTFQGMRVQAFVLPILHASSQTIPVANSDSDTTSKTHGLTGRGTVRRVFDDGLG